MMRIWAPQVMLTCNLCLEFLLYDISLPFFRYFSNRIENIFSFYLHPCNFFIFPLQKFLPPLRMLFLCALGTQSWCCKGHEALSVGSRSTLLCCPTWRGHLTALVVCLGLGVIVSNGITTILTLPVCSVTYLTLLLISIYKNYQLTVLIGTHGKIGWWN